MDGYNVIHSWPSLRALLPHSLELARDTLVERLVLLHQVEGVQVTVVFDAHRTSVAHSSREARDGVDVVFTRRGRSADHAIERMAYEHAERRLPLMVATSDRFHRDMLRGMGAAVIGSRELELRVEAAERDLRTRIRRSYGG